MVNAIDKFISWAYTYRIWGPRCSEIEPTCINCEKWDIHDELFNEGK